MGPQEEDLTHSSTFNVDMYPLTPYPITPIGNFIGAILALLPLLSQVRKLSLAIWGYSIWIALYCFSMFVNTVIWHDNVNIVVPVWCDIGEYLSRLVQSELLTEPIPIVTNCKLVQALAPVYALLQYACTCIKSDVFVHPLRLLKNRCVRQVMRNCIC